MLNITLKFKAEKMIDAGVPFDPGLRVLTPDI